MKHEGWRCRFSLVVMKKNIRGNTVVFYWSSWKKTWRPHGHGEVIYNLRHNLNTILSGNWRELWANPLETGVQVRLMSSVGSLLFLSHANYKVKYNHCDEFIQCLDGAFVSSEVNTLNSSGSDPRRNAVRGTTVIFYRPSWNKHKG